MPCIDILDDIDTMDDMCRENNEAFRSMVMKKQAEKSKYMCSFDGSLGRERGGMMGLFGRYRDREYSNALRRREPDQVPMQKKRSQAVRDHIRAVLHKTTGRTYRKEDFYTTNYRKPGQKNESTALDWAREEVERAGLLDKDSDYEGMLGEAVLELMSIMSKQGHSGMSAALVTEIFQKLANYEPLTPLTNDPNEWCDLCEEHAEGVPPYMRWQSKRDPSCFSSDGGKTYWSSNDDCFKEVDEDTGITFHTGDPERFAKRTIHTSVERAKG